MMRRGFLASTLGFSAGLFLAMPAGATEPFTGTYVVAAIRAASGVATTLSAQAASRLPAVGDAFDFASPVAWYDGDPCFQPNLQPAADAPFDVLDPNLSDLQLIFAAEGQAMPLNLPFTLDCGGRAVTSIKHLIQIDDRTLVWVTPDGATFVVLERMPSPENAIALEEALTTAGFTPGPVDGAIDAQTRSAVAAFAFARGASYQFATGVVTSNILHALIGKN